HPLLDEHRQVVLHRRKGTRGGCRQRAGLAALTPLLRGGCRQRAGLASLTPSLRGGCRQRAGLASLTPSLSVPRRTVEPMRPVTDLQRTVAPLEVVSEYQPAGDQPTAIADLTARLQAG